MAVFLAEAFPSFHFEGDDFVALNVTNDLGFDNSFHVFSDGERTVTGSQEYITKFDLITSVARDTGDVQSLVFLDLKLHAGYFHYC
jgi:hypothetical protein